MNKKIVIFSILLTVLFSCQKIKNTIQILKWQNRELQLTEDFSNHFLHPNISSTNYQYFILTFIDGSCSPCIGELKQWEEFSAKLPENSKLIVVIYAVNNTLTDDYISKFSLTTFLDDANYILTNNKLPDNKIFHTILIDKNKKIKLLGNPLYSEEIEKVYFEIMIE